MTIGSVEEPCNCGGFSGFRGLRLSFFSGVFTKFNKPREKDGDAFESGVWKIRSEAEKLNNFDNGALSGDSDTAGDESTSTELELEAMTRLSIEAEFTEPREMLMVFLFEPEEFFSE